MTSDPTKPAPHGVLAYTNRRMMWTPAIAYDNVFCYRVLPTPTVRPNLLSDTRDYSNLAALNPQALEMDYQLSWNGLTHNMAWQFNFQSGVVRFFNHAAQQWILAPGTIPVPDFKIGAKITAEYELTDSATIHRAITINDVIFPINVTQAATQTGFANKFTIATQLDANSKGQPISVNVNRICVRYL